MRAAAELAFWTSVFVLGYTYLGYPILAWLRARLRFRPVSRGDTEPSVTLIVVAHDEAHQIDDRLRNLAALDYPRDRLQVVVGSDGSTDATVERARKWEPMGIEVEAFGVRRGKPAVLNDLIARARGEIVVLADARQRFAPGALRALVAPFADPSVGAVSGELVLTQSGDAAAIGDGVGAYWRYEKFIRRNESRADSSVGATGAIYAIRRWLFEPIPVDTILDDVWLPMRIARRGYRVLFEPGALAYDRAPVTAAEEFARKVRTLAGNIQLLVREGWLLSPGGNRLWLETISHKALRLLTPPAMLTALGADLILAVGSPIHRVTLAAQGVFYAAALGGHLLRGAGWRVRVLAIPYVICFLSLATVVAFFRFAGHRQPVTWDVRSRARAGRAA